MPYPHAIIAIRLLDYDAGDDIDGVGTADEMLDYLTSRILSFRFSDHARKKDMIEMNFRNEDYSLFDRPIFVKGQKLLVTWGFPGATAAPRRVIIVSIKGGREVTVRGHCTLSLFDKKKQSRFMAGVTDSEFVRAVASEYGYKGTLVHIDRTDERHDITQARWMTDARMMRKLAKRNGFDFYVDSTGLHWHKQPASREPFHNYIYKRDAGQGEILEPPEFEANLTKGVSKVRVVARDPLLRAVVEGTAGINDETDVSLGNEDELFDPDDADLGNRGARISEDEVVIGGLMTAAEAKLQARGRYRDTARKRYKLTLKVIGNARMGAKNLIGLWGDVSVSFSGLYHIHEVITDIAGGKFTMMLRGRKDSLAEVRAAKKRRRRVNVNAAGDKLPKDASSEFRRIITPITLPSGEIVPGWLFTDDDGATGQTSAMDEYGFNQLSEKERNDFRYSMGAVTYPDS